MWDKHNPMPSSHLSPGVGEHEVSTNSCSQPTSSCSRPSAWGSAWQYPASSCPAPSGYHPELHQLLPASRYAATLLSRAWLSPGCLDVMRTGTLASDLQEENMPESGAESLGRILLPPPTRALEGSSGEGGKWPVHHQCHPLAVWPCASWVTTQGLQTCSYHPQEGHIPWIPSNSP